jgi:hypothetical protein
MPGLRGAKCPDFQEPGQVSEQEVVVDCAELERTGEGPAFLLPLPSGQRGEGGDQYSFGKTMESVTLSTKYQLVIPRRARERLGLRPA